MPLRDFTCVSCGKQQERFYHNANVLPTECVCVGTLQMLERSDERSRRFIGTPFPFVTNHIDPKGRPMTIENIGHLRRVEKEYGVALTAFSNTNFDDHIKDPPRYRGWDREREHTAR